MMEFGLQPLVIMIAPLINLLLLASFFLGLAPALGADFSQEDSLEVTVKEYEIPENMADTENFEVEPSSTHSLIKNETMESPLEIPTERVYLAPLTNVPPAPEVEKKEELEIAQDEPKQGLDSVEPEVLGALGIKRLAKGINIFRFSSYYLESRSPLANRRALPQNSVQ